MRHKTPPYRPLLPLRWLLEEADFEAEDPDIELPYLCGDYPYDCALCFGFYEERVLPRDLAAPAETPVWQEPWRDPAPALAWRNARLAALLDRGVPLEGGWRYEPGDTAATLALRCQECGRDGEITGRPDGPAALARLETRLVGAQLFTHGCRHLAPVLAEDDEELAALTALELLALR
jgi:hypothetical protein